MPEFNPNRIMHGNGGHAWFNGKKLTTLQSVEAKVAGDFEEINVCGDPATYLKIDSDVLSLMAAAYKSGEMPTITIITSQTMPGTSKAERVAYSDITIDEFTLAKFEKKSKTEEEIPFKFGNFEVLETLVADSDAPILRWWGIPAACPADIRSALAENPADEEFVLEINSGGGSVFAGFEMYSLLRNASRQGVHTRAEVQSLAGSAASVVMAGADTAACSPVGQVMIHLPSTVTEGNQGVHRESVQMLESITESIIAAYESKVGGKTSHDALRRMMDRETFLSARAALDAGLIDEIIGEEQPGEPLNLNNIYNACGAVPDMDKLRAAYIAAQSQSQEPEPQPPVSNLNTARKRAIAIAEAELRAVVV